MKILFMCVANSARSQLAEGLARALFPDLEIRSAGSHPGKLNPYAVTVMKEIGLDISSHYSKSMDDLPPKFIVGIDYIITLCAEEVCPMMIAPRAKKLHWPFPDPATKEPLSEAKMLTRFREARDSIQEKLKQFKAELEK
jgi:arsenate reductase